jgi:hypothetical protein
MRACKASGSSPLSAEDPNKNVRARLATKLFAWDAIAQGKALQARGSRQGHPFYEMFMQATVFPHRWTSFRARAARNCCGRAARERVPSAAEFITLLRDAPSQSLQPWDILFLSCARITYSNELWSSADPAALKRSASSWQSRCKDLCPLFQHSVTDISQLSPDSVDVKWRATWVPKQLLWLDSLGKAWPGLSVEYFDALDRYEDSSAWKINACFSPAYVGQMWLVETSLGAARSRDTQSTECRYDQRIQFKWRALFNLLANAFKTGVLRVPVAAIESTWTIRTSGEHQEDVAVSERTWLIPLFQQLKVKNRKIARDMLLWQEVRQPAGMTYTTWDRQARH